MLTVLAVLTAAMAAAPAHAEAAQEEMVFWQSVEDSGDIAMLEAYKRRYPDGAFIELADLKIAAIAREQAEAEELQAQFEALMMQIFSGDTAKMLKNQPEKPRPLADPSAKVTISEIDAVRRQIQRCWNVPAGARGAENLVIAIKTRMNRDGTVEAANIVDSTRTRNDNFYRTAAESALRAVLNDKCQPFKLSPEKYADWREITFTFDPREIF